MKYLLSASTLLALALSGCANIPTATEDSVKNRVEVIGGNEESLREFIRQWVLPVNPDSTPMFYIGSAPKDMPYDLPVPDDARLIGSVTGFWADYMLIFDTSLPPESVQGFYAQVLKEKGWLTSIANEGGGLIAPPDSNFYKDYCYGEHEVVLSVETLSISVEKTSIRLSLHTTPDTWPCKPEFIPENLELIYDHIPALRPPKGVTMGEGTGGTSTGEEEAHTTLTLTGDLSAAEVVDFYNEQLLAAGWKMRNGGDVEGAAWSNWTFQDEQGSDWIGTLMVVKAASESNTLFAVVTVEKTK